MYTKSKGQIKKLVLFFKLWSDVSKSSMRVLAKLHLSWNLICKKVSKSLVWGFNFQEKNPFAEK